MSDTSGSPDVDRITERVQEHGAFLAAVREQVGRVIVGHDALLRRLQVGLLCDGHVLLEGLPGLAKSLTVTTFARCLGLPFRRIQFTPDLLPADLLGTLVYRPDSGEFHLRRGPVFASVVLADEINRAPPKVQSALLEAMQERQVSIGDETLSLPEPFLVLATQNPVEHEGTYALPEAQVDRFLLKVRLGYPSAEDELEMLRRHGRTRPDHHVDVVADAGQILNSRAVVDEVYVDERIQGYVLALVNATRDPSRVGLDDLSASVRFGASPRASLALLMAAKAEAFLEGRGYVRPIDVKTVAAEVLAHRIGLTFEAEAREHTGDSILEAILARTEVP